MNKLFFIILLLVTMAVACKHHHEHDENGNHIETEGAHVHDDGSVHTDHVADTAIEQEQFVVSEADSIPHNH